MPSPNAEKCRVLFICIHNSARSQMAEAFLNASPGFVARSSGLEPGQLNPVVVEAMREVGIDISRHRTKTVDDVLRSGERFDYVITVCDEANAARCPVFPGKGQRLHWPFDDPSALCGSSAERLKGTRLVRDAIQARVRDFVREQSCLTKS